MFKAKKNRVFELKIAFKRNFSKNLPTLRLAKHIYDCFRNPTKQREFFASQTTKNPSFRKNSLKRFQNVLIRKENDINAALAPI